MFFETSEVGSCITFEFREEADDGQDLVAGLMALHVTVVTWCNKV